MNLAINFIDADRIIIQYSIKLLLPATSIKTKFREFGINSFSLN